MAKQQKTTTGAEPVLSVPKAINPTFGVTGPVPAGTVGTTSLVAYGWCAGLTSDTSHVIKCKVEKTTGDAFDPPTITVNATLYCGNPPTLWSAQILYPSTALTTDRLKLTVTLEEVGGAANPIGTVTRSDLVPDPNATTPIPTPCDDDTPPDDELELEEVPVLYALEARGADEKAAAKRRFKADQPVAFTFRPRRRVRSAQAVVARATRNSGKIEKVLAVIPATLSGTSPVGPDRCDVIVPVPKNADQGNDNYIVEVILLNKDGVRVGLPHREVLGRSTK